MKTHKQEKITEWYSADRMHEMSKNWLSDLNFIKDEQLFLEDLITNYTQKIIDSDALDRAQNVATALQRTKRGNQKLLTALKRHENELQIMVDGKDELEKENKYKAEHQEFTKTISSFYFDYKAVKFEIFELVKQLMKTDKEEHLLK
ncbi:hypothetical protein [Olleya aquimaris]|uniref:Uncharacterized protein n=1 Tax=Olleya aquimaris TaxID=639310 RepID=A0A327RJJ7_9FLAO|nr:hypothetical protein [Olleya aquimaris]RAJ16408.1 hypothetical protein LY08_01268 [Olleya aquimaris]